MAGRRARAIFRTTCLASKSCETCFDGAAIEVACDDGVDEAPPVSVLVFKTLFPCGLDVFVVELEQLIKRARASVSRAIQRDRLEERLGSWEKAHRAGLVANAIPSAARSSTPRLNALPSCS